MEEYTPMVGPYCNWAWCKPYIVFQMNKPPYSSLQCAFTVWSGQLVLSAGRLATLCTVRDVRDEHIAIARLSAEHQHVSVLGFS